MRSGILLPYMVLSVKNRTNVVTRGFKNPDFYVTYFKDEAQSERKRIKLKRSFYLIVSLYIEPLKTGNNSKEPPKDCDQN